MGISRLSAYEIAGNYPDDIVTEAMGPFEDSKYMGIIRRGPGHNGKWIISSKPVFDSAKEAELHMDNLVKELVAAVKEELGGKGAEE